MQEKVNIIIKKHTTLVLLIALSALILAIFSFRRIFSPVTPSISILESGVETENYRETIHINNCGGMADSEQTISRSSTFSVGSTANTAILSEIETSISAKYQTASNISRSLQIVAPPNTNMEYIVAWTDEKHVGIVQIDNDSTQYNFNVPLTVELISARDLGCGQVIVTITPTPTESPVELAILNITSNPQSDGTVIKTAELSIAPLGLGSIDLSYPSTMKLGESSNISLVLTPNSALTNLPKAYVTPLSPNSPATITDFILNYNDQIEIYPVMSAELKGINFNILADEYPEKPVVSSSSVEWIWNVKPTSAGKQSLVVSISVPVIIDKAHDFISARPIKNIALEIIINEQEVATPTSTATPLPPIQRIGEKLIDESAIVFGAILALVAGLVTAYVTYVTNKNKETKNVETGKSGDSKPQKPRRK